MYNIKCVSLRATASEYTCDGGPQGALAIAAGRAPACVAAVSRRRSRSQMHYTLFGNYSLDAVQRIGALHLYRCSALRYCDHILIVKINLMLL